MPFLPHLQETSQIKLQLFTSSHCLLIYVIGVILVKNSTLKIHYNFYNLILEFKENLISLKSQKWNQFLTFCSKHL
jgi:hypothetical protein